VQELRDLKGFAHFLRHGFTVSELAINVYAVSGFNACAVIKVSNSISTAVLLVPLPYTLVAILVVLYNIVMRAKCPEDKFTYCLEVLRTIIK